MVEESGIELKTTDSVFYFFKILTNRYENLKKHKDRKRKKGKSDSNFYTIGKIPYELLAKMLETT